MALSSLEKRLLCGWQEKPGAQRAAPRACARAGVRVRGGDGPGVSESSASPASAEQRHRAAETLALSAPHDMSAWGLGKGGEGDEERC